MKNLPIICPCKTKSTVSVSKEYLICDQTDCEHHNVHNSFPIVNNIPILISETRTDTLFTRNNQISYIKRPFRKFGLLRKIIYGESKVTKSNCGLFLSEVFKINSIPKVLIIGGGERGSGTDELWNNKNIQTHSIDVYASDNVDLICDSHYLPLENSYYDGVWIQAVLEHVVEPKVVVTEIHRVLKTGGIIYSETPFMQQVHEGAYDFNRFTVLGHRYLFKQFELISLGGNQGPEVVFAWSTRYLFWSIFRSKKLAIIVGLIMGLFMRPLGSIISKKSMFDACSGVFFLGKKTSNYKIKHIDLLELYGGQY